MTREEVLKALVERWRDRTNHAVDSWLDGKFFGMKMCADELEAALRTEDEERPCGTCDDEGFLDCGDGERRKDMPCPMCAPVIREEQG